MSTEAPSGEGSVLKFFLVFFGVIIFLAIFTRDGRTILPSLTPLSSTSTPSTGVSSQNAPPPTTISTPSTPPPPRLTDREVETRLVSLYRELDGLREDLRAAKLREPASPYAGMVKIGGGNVRDTDPEREYLTLRAASGNASGVDISRWYFESYVTEEVAAIPRGDRVLTTWRSPELEDIVLLPGEAAYVSTYYSPIDVSFHENACTGYLLEEESFYPSIGSRCPRPMDELKRVGTIRLDDDTCYNFVERMNQCVTPDDATYDDAVLTGACRRFLDHNFGYNNCVAIHARDPFFDDVGDWHVYLERDDDLWREEREIIRLRDENGLIVDVLEY